MSRLHVKKGVEMLLEAWPLVRARVPDAQLVIAGDGAPGYVKELRARHMQMGAPDRGTVAFAGFVTGEGKAAALGAADLFVLPSQQENFGVAVVEAIAAGLPVVVSPEVQLASFVQRRQMGIVVPRTPAALATAIASSLLDLSLRERVARTGAEVVVEEFSPRAVGERLRAMYAAAVDHAT